MSGTNKSPLALSPPPPPSLSLLSRSLSLLSSLSPVSSLWPHWAAWVGLALNGPRLAGYGPPGPPAAACWAWPSPALIRTGPGPVGPSWAEDSERRLRCPPDRATVARDSETSVLRVGPAHGPLQGGFATMVRLAAASAVDLIGRGVHR